ncbi:MAG: VacJ family lipoprotein [Proteobacteria bacterium]|nr:VacJ family lipoprotein [Pseudomonadota bacterium]
MRATTLRTAVLTACLAAFLGGCASLPKDAQRSARDPWERMNRATYKFNDALDRGIVKPVAKGYVKVTPQPVRTGVTNFFDNLETPISMVNDLLQWQIRDFFNDTARLVLNTTLGIGGLLDPATRAGLDKNDRDFGQTLGKWGLKSGPYVVLPVLGPSDVRDAAGRLADNYSTPRAYISDPWVQWGLWAARGIDTRSRLLYTDQIVQSSYDPYAFVRNAYLQHRDFKVSGGGAGAGENQQEQQLLDEADQLEKENAAGAQPPPAPAPKPDETPASTPPPK